MKLPVTGKRALFALSLAALLVGCGPQAQESAPAAPSVVVSQPFTDYKQASLLNREFHFGLIAAARMPVIFKTLENMWVMMGPLLSTFHAEVPKAELASAKHKHFEVLEALRKRDSAKAKAALQADIAWGELMVEWLERKSLAQG
ncbi:MULTISPECIES: FCD domain-containing protein [Pseudomonas]|uniref:FCD domain-containing protein n=1 Tax=Pseudomonas asiatica TaxID=2219225 RepID=A0ABU5KTC5_9PSED|nr:MULTISPECIES: FCD domain-containing protein [Pseudomonas]MCE0849972.1 FCD domain-containing protein [Pseudomonas asiatica]MDZ5737190.1 FCD domain-containing protein [Pseudomonas asiatica]MDZ5742132.1 FCD domain-containing protein [Pseudomonas asiatica]MDZ5747420.1 FCD domain-containing protein [Pseudomonas asiatica]MDZ5752536.1 FCD domain-containing protein [Pseudomonas asiatica]